MGARVRSETEPNALDMFQEMLDALDSAYIIQKNKDGQFFVALIHGNSSSSAIRPSLREALDSCISTIRRNSLQKYI